MVEKPVVSCQLRNCAVRKMNVQFELRVNNKFCVKLGKTPTETLQLLSDAYGDDALSWARVFEWHR
jgi:hypothetical protein